MRYFIILLIALLTACGSAAPSVKPFKMDIQQGNVVTSKMLLQLRPGMTKSQVRFIMGTPLIVDSFHKDRWDYFYQLRQAGKIVEQRRVILDFDKDFLIKVRGDVVPEGTAGAATSNESSVAKTITVEPKPKQEKGLLDKLKFWEKDELDKAAVKPEVASKPTLTETTPPANVDAPASDTPSILAVPIGSVLTADSPVNNVPKPQASVAEEPAVTSPMVETPEIEKPAAETLAVEIPAVQAPAIAPQAATMPEKLAPTKPKMKQDERLIFRMDRKLDSKNLDTAPIEASPAVVKAKLKPKQAEQPIPPQEEPGYFERMLEKIGF